MGHNNGSPKRKVYSHECIYQKDRKISNQKPNTTAETPRKTVLKWGTGGSCL
jgi:hypothetical protein